MDSIMYTKYLKIRAVCVESLSTDVTSTVNSAQAPLRHIGDST